MGGIETRIDDENDEYDDFDDEQLAADEEMPYSESEEGTAAEDAAESLRAMSEPLVAQATSLSRKKALIVNAFPAFERDRNQIRYRTGFYRKVAQYWRRSKGVSTTLWESNIRVGTLSLLNNYDFVIIATHGARYIYWAGPKNNRKLYEVSTFHIAQPRNDRYYAKALKDRQIARMRNGYLVLPKFFRVRYKPYAFRSVVVACETCSLFGNNRLDTELPGVFTKKGATAAVGFLNTVKAGYARNFVKAFGDNMFEGKTVGAAMSAAMRKVGQTQRDWWSRNFRKSYPNRYNAYPKYVGKQNGRLI